MFGHNLAFCVTVSFDPCSGTIFGIFIGLGEKGLSHPWDLMPPLPTLHMSPTYSCNAINLLWYLRTPQKRFCLSVPVVKMQDIFVQFVRGSTLVRRGGHGRHRGHGHDHRDQSS